MARARWLLSVLLVALATAAAEETSCGRPSSLTSTQAGTRPVISAPSSRAARRLVSQAAVTRTDFIRLSPWPRLSSRTAGNDAGELVSFMVQRERSRNQRKLNGGTRSRRDPSGASHFL